MRPVVLLWAPVAAAVVFLVRPIAALVMRSLSAAGPDGMIDVLGDTLFLESVARTLMLSTVVTAACTVIGVIYAVALTLARRPLRLALLAVLFSTFWISLLVRTFGWVILLQPNGALDQALRGLGLIDAPLAVFQTAPAMYPAMVHVMLPFLILPVYAACIALDPRLLRAAQSLGAGAWAVAWHVLIPQLRPAIVAGAALVFMISLAFYVTPLLLGGPSDLTVATLIDREFHEVYDLGSAATMALLLLIVVLVLYLVVDRFVQIVPGSGLER